jgi:cysteine desulfurase / selenocysteine lyase
MSEDAVVLTTVLEHHSNLLPWRRRGAVVHVRACRDGSVDEEDLDTALARHAGHVALLAVTGASNVTGVVPAVHRMAEKVHAVGGRILVDAAQLAGHRGVDMRPHSDAGHLDAVALSAHKMYAPYGAGALITGRDCLGADPDECGGGTVRAVTLDTVVWADLPDRAEAGSPNLLGVVAFAAAARRLRELGMRSIAAHEQALAAHLREQLGALSGVTIAGPACPDLGVVSFGIDGVDHRLVAAILGYEHGIGVRSGCFCAQPYVQHLLQLSPGDVARWVAEASRGDMRRAPGLVRISLGGYSSNDDVDRAVDALRRIIAGEIEGCYRQRPDGSFVPHRANAANTPRARRCPDPGDPAVPRRHGRR